MKRQLDRVFNPQSIAVIGASNQVGKVGYLAYQNLKSYGFKKKLFPVNLQQSTIQGDRAYRNIAQIKAKVDLVIIATAC